MSAIGVRFACFFALAFFLLMPPCASFAAQWIERDGSVSAFLPTEEFIFATHNNWVQLDADSLGHTYFCIGPFEPQGFSVGSNGDRLNVVRCARVISGCSDITGNWSNTLDNGRTSTWVISQAAGGGYSAQESGIGSARGTAVSFSGTTLTITFRTGSGTEGYYQWDLGPICLGGRGTLVFTKGQSGSEGSTISR